MDLERLLTAFQKGETSFETLDAAVARVLTNAPQRAGEVRTLLKTARDQGLPKHVYAALVGNLDLVAPQPDATATPPTSLENAEPEEVKTLVLSSEDKTQILSEEEKAPKVTPRRGSIADNARRLAKDSEATEHTLMTYLGKEFTSQTQDAPSQVTTPGDIFRQPFTDDEIAGADVTALQGIDVGASDKEEFGPGYMLRSRFQLTTKLGEGGMGAVWRARDMLKVRARDRNPYVAIKLLAGDFREHPEAFIALQRETSKQQRLAHPNVATVFDFDRDQNTNTVFMTMEAMEGQSMDRFIRKLPADGLSVAEAMPIIEQLGAGLAYAHQNGLVHSDLKPGNCFVTKEGVVKLLDFGIARASKTEAHAEGERTLFDPGKLGAITPTYATVEMFEGMDPDPRDDIYALAIMAYQLFTGKHPFGKQNAVKAMSMGLAPPYVAKLNNRQNRGLAKGLAFTREKRTATVEEFLEDIRPQQSRIALYAGGGLAALLLLALLAYEPATDLIRTRENETVVQQIADGTLDGIRTGLARAQSLESSEQKRAVFGDPRTVAALVAQISTASETQIDALLALIEGLEPQWRQDVLNANSVRSAVFKIFEQRISNAFNPDEEKLDYPSAAAHLKALDRFYPQSAAVLTIETRLREQQQSLVTRLEDSFETLFESGAIIAAEGEIDVTDVLDELRALSPEHPLLSDDRLRFRAAELAEQALRANDPEAAAAYVAAGLRYSPDDATLSGLGHRAAAAAEQVRRVRLAGEITERLRAKQAGLNSLKAFAGIQIDIAQLAVLEPGNKLAGELLQRHRILFDEAFAASLKSSRTGDAGALLYEHAAMMDTARLIELRQALPGTANAADDSKQAELVEILNTRLGEPDASTEWVTRTVTQLRSLIAVSPGGDPRVDELRSKSGRFLLYQAEQAAAEERFDAARAWISRAEMADPGSATGAELAVKVGTMELAARQRRERERQRAELESTKGRFKSAIEARRPDRAETMLNQIVALTQPEADADFIAAAYAELGAAYAGTDNFTAALRIVTAGIAASPDSQQLRESRQAYRAEVDRRALLIALRSRFDSIASIDVDATATDLETLKNQFPDRIAEMRAELIAGRRAKLVEYVQGNDFDPSLLKPQLEAIATLFPQHVASVRQAVAGVALKRVEAERQRDALSARQLLDQIMHALPDDQALAKLSRTLPPAKILMARRMVESGQLNAAGELLESSRASLESFPEFGVLSRTISIRKQQATQKFETFVSNVKKGVLRSQPSRQRAFSDVISLWSDNTKFTRVDYVNRQPGACLPDLAGSGKDSEGVCYDYVAKDIKGPLMVVVPPASVDSRPFAIGKYEVSVAEFNQFCAASGSCKQIAAKNDKLPVTGVRLRDAQNYAKWLSEQASASAKKSVLYRLPNVSEWRHAAAANGALPSRGINCRPEGGASLSSGLMRSEDGTLSLGVPIGRALVSATFGGENGWGLVNAIGNAQEWVTAATGVSARGGAFQDSLASCSLFSNRPHDGAPDEFTGFRLVRELG